MSSPPVIIETVKPDALMANIDANMNTFMTFFSVIKYGDKLAQTVESNTSAIARLRVFPIPESFRKNFCIPVTAIVPLFILPSLHCHMQYFILVIFASLKSANYFPVGEYQHPVCDSHDLGQLSRYHNDGDPLST